MRLSRNSRSAEAMFLRAGKFALLNGALVMEEHVPQWEWRLDPSPNSQSEPATQKIVACQPPPDFRPELTPPPDTETSSLKTDGGRMLDGLRPTITRDDVERFRRRALECRAEAEIEFDPVRRWEREETALAYERMAGRAERYVAE